jgi:hypothetical protein
MGRAGAGPLGYAVRATGLAICLQHEASLATRNTRDFADTAVQLFDPWTDHAG